MICCSWGDVFISYFSIVFCCWHMGSGGCCCNWCGKMKVLARMHWRCKHPEIAVGYKWVEALGYKWVETGWFPGVCACAVRAALSGRDYVSCLDLSVGNLLSLLDLQPTHWLSGRLIKFPECIKTNLVKTRPLLVSLGHLIVVFWLRLCCSRYWQKTPCLHKEYTAGKCES